MKNLTLGLTVFISGLFGPALYTYSITPPPCEGWDCEIVHCPNKYAVLTPHGYLPCEKFNSYTQQNDMSVLIGDRTINGVSNR